MMLKTINKQQQPILPSVCKKGKDCATQSRQKSGSKIARETLVMEKTKLRDSAAGLN